MFPGDDNLLGLIAGNGAFPLLVLDAARAQGLTVVVAAIKEETFPEIERHGAAAVHWLSLGELSRLIETFKQAGVRRAIMAGQVKHKQIFSSIRPDWRLAKLLLSLATRNTDSLIGAIANVLADEGITLLSSTSLLDPLLAKPGVLSRRAPNERELADVAFGRAAARHLAQYDIGQTVVVAEAACVAVEAMEGTDATIERAGRIMASLESAPSKPESGSPGTPGLLGTPQPLSIAGSNASHPAQDNCGGSTAVPTLSRALTVVKVAKPKQDMRYDVPVVGVRTIEAMQRAGATCLALDSGKCLLLDGEKTIVVADAAGIAIVAE